MEYFSKTILNDFEKIYCGTRMEFDVQSSLPRQKSIASRKMIYIKHIIEFTQNGIIFKNSVNGVEKILRELNERTSLVSISKVLGYHSDKPVYILMDGALYFLNGSNSWKIKSKSDVKSLRICNQKSYYCDFGLYFDENELIYGKENKNNTILPLIDDRKQHTSIKGKIFMMIVTHTNMASKKVTLDKFRDCKINRRDINLHKEVLDKNN